MTRVTESKEQILELGSGQNTPHLTIEQLSGSIVIETWDRRAVRVQMDDDEDGDIADMVQIRRHDGDIYIGNNLEHTRPRHRRDHRREIAQAVEDAMHEGDVSGIGEHVSHLLRQVFTPRPDLDLRLTVPANCDVTAHSLNGDIAIERVDGNLYIETASGDVVLTRCSGNVIAKTASGDLLLTGFTGRIGIRTASGDLRVDRAQLQAFNIGTISGDVALETTLAPDGEYGLRTTSGDVDLSLPPDTRCSVQVRTVSGDVDCELPFTRAREGRRHMTLAINGGGPTIQFESTSGDLEILPWRGEREDGDHAQADAADGTRRLRREDAPDLSADEPFRVEGAAAGRPTSRLSADAAPRQSAEMAILEAIERGELSVDEGLARLADL